MAQARELVESVEVSGDLVRPVHKYSIDKDIDKLFEAIDIKNSYKSLVHLEKNSKDVFSKRAMKRPMKVSSSRSSGIGFSEPASLKQAFRGLCISHASEMAAMKKQLSKATPSGISKALGEANLQLNKGKGSLLEVSLVPESSIAMSSSLGCESNRSNIVGMDCIYAQTVLKKRLKLRNASIGSSLNTKLPVLDENVCDYTSRSRRKVKTSLSLSSRSSTVDNRSSVSSSEESFISGSSCKRYRPHMSKDSRWKAVRYVEQKQGSLGLKHFKLLKKLGGGDIGNIYLSVLIGTNCLFALKVMDIDLLASRRKLTRAQTEKEILQMIDHPFLPSLYAHFTTEKFSCLLMEYCPGGDLHVLRQMQLTRSFSEQATRFYIAEVVLALEYLHMIGVVYRDLKPENVLVQEDGHIMLTDFDLSLTCAVNLTMLKTDEHPKTTSSRPSLYISCINPFCFQTSLQIPCFNAKFVSQETTQSRTLPLLVVEPIDARSNSFVGTHEYLAPEMIKGEGHGSAVDWWTLGILLYELLYGKTPFKGENEDILLTNIVSESLVFPETPIVSSNARYLIRCLLKKEPQERLGFEKGAAEIKQHPFFQGLNWALIRCVTPPHLPIIAYDNDMGNCNSRSSSYNIENERSLGEYAIAEDAVLEMF